MVTIREVARHSGLSVATVSRVINGSRSVTEDTRKLVEASIADLHYTPNALARNLRRSRSGVLVAMLPSISNIFYTRIVDGIEHEAKRAGYSVLLCQTHNDVKEARRYLGLVSNRLADGLIALDPLLAEGDLEQLARRFPVVQACEVSARVPAPAVTIDNRAAAREAVDVLVESGARRIALVALGERFMYSREREFGYRDGLANHGLDLDTELIVHATENDFTVGYDAAASLLKLAERPDGIFLVSDILAAGAIKAAHDAGVDVPRRLRIVGFDNIQIASMTTPSLTTVAQPMFEIGQCAARMLLDLLDQPAEEQRSRVLGYDVIRRETTDPTTTTQPLEGT